MEASWTSTAALAMTVLAILAAVVVIGAPVWRELVIVPRAKAKAIAQETARVEAEVKAANEWLERKRGSETVAKCASRAPANKTCWGCGALGSGYKACAKCVSLGLEEPCVFCSADCLASSWPRHKAWHASQVTSSQPAPHQTPQSTKEQEDIQAALRAVEQRGERIAVPVKRPTKRKAEPKTGGKEQEHRPLEQPLEQPSNPSSAADGEKQMSDYNAQLERAEEQQKARERSQLATAFEQLIEQLQRDNPGKALEATRDNFGKLVAQIEVLLSSERHNDTQVGRLFESEAVNAKVDLRAFLSKESTIDWFLAPPETTAKKSLNGGRAQSVSQDDARIHELD